MKTRAFGLCVTGFFLAAVTAANAGIVTAPYTEDFNDGTAGSMTLQYGQAPATADPTPWTLPGTTLNYAENSVNTEYAAASVQTANATTGVYSFNVSADVAPTTMNFSSGWLFLHARAGDANLGQFSVNANMGYSVRLRVGFDTSYKLALFKSGVLIGTEQTLSFNPSGANFYAFSLAGDVQGNGDLLLTGKLTNGTNTATVTATDPAAGVITGNGTSTTPLGKLKNIRVFSRRDW
ncbi:MAG: hypothetical protein ACYC26_14785 [Phycisphaerales bacterium]